jgi:hypothetical protein
MARHRATKRERWEKRIGTGGTSCSDSRRAPHEFKLFEQSCKTKRLFEERGDHRGLDERGFAVR